MRAARLLDRLPPERIPAASGLNNFLRITGGSFATSLTTTYWDRREAFHQSHLVASLTVYDPSLTHTLAQLHQQGIAELNSAALVLRQVVIQAYLMSSVDIFYVSGWLALALVPLCWMVRRPRGGSVAAGAD